MEKAEGVNVTFVNFGAFVDIGIHEDGLIHISHMSRKFIKTPSQVVALEFGERLVKKIDTERSKEKVNLSLAPNETMITSSRVFTRGLRPFYPSCPVIRASTFWVGDFSQRWAFGFFLI